jgi:thioesterase domain-containing protein
VQSIPAKLVQEVTSAFAAVELFNEYGPTEATVWATVHRCSSADIDPVPIGRPISNTRIYLLDSHGNPVPLGAVGEMYIGGMGVARGYLNLAELTAERFLLDPFAGKPDARMYKTGDLARYLPNGNLVFLGRNDDQVKIRGLRIEPGEIVARLTEHSSVREAVVEVQNVDTNRILVAYFVAQPESLENDVFSSADSEAGSPLAGQLRVYLSERLPDYMVPSAFVLIESLPLTPNGKLDRKSLPVPKNEAFAHADYEAPQGETEMILAALWSGMLPVERVGRHDSFFTLGGHSLMAVQLLQKIRSHGLECSLADIFEQPQLISLASKIARPPVFNMPKGVITVRAGGTESPVFFVPSGLADFSYAISLATHLRADCPIHVLPWSTIGDPLPHSMEDMAERMVALIQAIQPEGPYRMVGYSSGGILAYAIAHSLICKEAGVEFLGFIDVPAPRKLLYKYKNIGQYFIEYVKSEASEAECIKLEALNADDEFGALIRKVQGLGCYDLNADVPAETVKWRAIYNFSQIAGAYESLLLPIDLYCFYATEREHEALPRTDIIGGWRETLPDITISSVPIRGGHISMMADVSNRKRLAQAIDRALSQEVKRER